MVKRLLFKERENNFFLSESLWSQNLLVKVQLKILLPSWMTHCIIWTFSRIKNKKLHWTLALWHGMLWSELKNFKYRLRISRTASIHRNVSLNTCRKTNNTLPRSAYHTSEKVRRILAIKDWSIWSSSHAWMSYNFRSWTKNRQTKLKWD